MEQEGNVSMNKHTATEIAYKNGYAKGLADGKGEVAREIFAEIDKRLDELTVVASPNDCFITTFRKTMEKVTAEVEEVKKNFTEDQA